MAAWAVGGTHRISQPHLRRRVNVPEAHLSVTRGSHEVGSITEVILLGSGVGVEDTHGSDSTGVAAGDDVIALEVAQRELHDIPCSRSGEDGVAVGEDAHHCLLVLGGKEASEVGTGRQYVDIVDSNLAISGTGEEANDRGTTAGSETTHLILVVLSEGTNALELLEVPHPNTAAVCSEHELVLRIDRRSVDHRLALWKFARLARRRLVAPILHQSTREEMRHTLAGSEIPHLHHVERAGQSEVAVLRHQMDEVQIVRVVLQLEQLTAALQVPENRDPVSTTAQKLLLRSMHAIDTLGMADGSVSPRHKLPTR